MHYPVSKAYRIIAIVQSAHLKSAMQYWLSLVPDAGLPAKSNFDLSLLHEDVRERTFKINVDLKSGNYSIGRAGGYLINEFGDRIKGLEADYNSPDALLHSATRRMVAALVETTEPQYYFGAADFRFRSDYVDHEQILLPLTDPGGRICNIIGFVDYLGLA